MRERGEDRPWPVSGGACVLPLVPMYGMAALRLQLTWCIQGGRAGGGGVQQQEVSLSHDSCDLP